MARRKKSNCRGTLGTLVDPDEVERISILRHTHHPPRAAHRRVTVQLSWRAHDENRGSGWGRNRRFSLSSQRCRSRPGISTHIVSWLPATVPSSGQTGKTLSANLELWMYRCKNGLQPRTGVVGGKKPRRFACGPQPRHFGREKAPGRLASQGSPRSWGGAITCGRDNRIRGGISTPRRRGISTSYLKKRKKKELGAPFWLAILATGRTGSASSS